MTHRYFSFILAIAWLVAMSFRPPVILAAGGSGKLELKKAITLALKNNFDLIIQRSDVKSEKETINEALGEFDPALSFDLSASRSETPIAEIFYPSGFYLEKNQTLSAKLEKKFLTTGAKLDLKVDYGRRISTSDIQTFSPQYSSSAILSLTQPLLKDFGRKNAGIKISLARQKSHIAALNTRAAVQDTAAKVATAYWKLAQADKVVSFRKDAVEFAAKIADAATQKAQAGEISTIQRDSALSELALRKQDLALSRLDAEVARQEFLLLLGKSDLEGPLVLAGDLDKVSIPSVPLLVESLENAYRSRSDLAALEIEKKRAGKIVDYYKNQCLPSLNLVGKYGFQGLSGSPNSHSANTSIAQTRFADQSDPWDAFNYYFDKDGFAQWMVGINFKIPIGNRAAKSRLAQAKIKKRQAEFKIQQLKKKIARDVQSAIEKLDIAREKMKINQNLIRLYKTRLSAAEKSFNSGLISVLGLLKEQNNMEKARIGDVEARTYGMTAYADYGKAAGDILSNYEIDADFGKVD